MDLGPGVEDVVHLEPQRASAQPGMLKGELRLIAEVGEEAQVECRRPARSEDRRPCRRVDLRRASPIGADPRAEAIVRPARLRLDLVARACRRPARPRRHADNRAPETPGAIVTLSTKVMVSVSENCSRPRLPPPKKPPPPPRRRRRPPKPPPPPPPPTWRRAGCAQLRRRSDADRVPGRTAPPDAVRPPSRIARESGRSPTATGAATSAAWRSRSRRATCRARELSKLTGRKSTLISWPGVIADEARRGKRPRSRSVTMMFEIGRSMGWCT